MIESVLLTLWTPNVRVIGDKTPFYYCREPDELKRLFSEAKFIHIIRDGRDVAVSHHFHALRQQRYRFFKNTEVGKKAKEFPIDGKGPVCDLFDEQSITYAAKYWIESIKGGWKARDLFGANYFEVRYQDLHKNPLLIREGFKFLGVSTNKIIVKYCIERNRFERLSGGRPLGDANPQSFFRKGATGDWRHYFSDRYNDLYKKYSGSMLVELGYEKMDNW